jgi:glycosyltransferase involved in cell wall biosynthesis
MLVSIVLPCFNEEENIEEMYSRLISVLQVVGGKYELLFVDDGSSDNSLVKLRNLCTADSNVRVLEFSRNFGHQAAISAGIDHARGDIVIMMDADLQHPPELIPALLEKWKQGYEIVYTVRRESQSISSFKRITAKLFYKLINLLSGTNVPENSADFRLLDKRVINELRSLGERTKFFRGLVSWVGFKQCAVQYESAQRYAGQRKYSVWKMMTLACEGIMSFSSYPLHIATVFGIVVSVFSFTYAAYAVYTRLFTQEALPGWTSILVSLLFLGGIQLISLGIIGGYLGRVYEELKGRPPYIIRNSFGWADRSACSERVDGD